MKYARAMAALALLTSVAVAQTPSRAQQRPPEVSATSSQTPTTAQSAPLVVSDAWIRVTPGTDLAAAYLTLRNVSGNTVTVTGIESPVAGHSMMHETRLVGGVSSMRPREQIAVAAGSTVKFEPGGLHVMLHDLKNPLTVGQAVPLVISIAGGAIIQVSATVRPLSSE